MARKYVGPSQLIALDQPVIAEVVLCFFRKPKNRLFKTLKSPVYVEGDISRVIAGETIMTNTYYKFSFSKDIPLKRIRQIFGLGTALWEAK